MNNPQTVSELFPTRFLCADDLKGRAFVLTVSRIEFEKMRSNFTHQEELKAVMYFEGAEKGMALNKTQCQAMATIAGSEAFKEWVGKRVHIYAGVYKGKKTIIVKPPPGDDLTDGGGV